MLEADFSFFTQRPAARYSVPHDPVDERWVLLAHLAVTRAFEIIRAERYPLSSALPSFESRRSARV
jgi:hypothetical protein